MKQIIIFFLFIISFSCAVRRTAVKTLNVDELRKNMHEVYNYFATAPRTGQFVYTSGEMQITGKITIIKNDSEWNILLRNPLNSISYRINEDTIPLLNFLKDSASPFSTKIVGSNIIIETPHNVAEVKIINSLPQVIRSEDSVISVEYKKRIPRTVTIQTADFSLRIKFD